MTTLPEHLKIIDDLRRLLPAEFTDDDVAELGQSFFARLSTVVGERMCEGLTDRQLQEFDDAPDEAAQLAFIERYRPDYRTTVDRAYRELLSEVEARFSASASQ